MARAATVAARRRFRWVCGTPSFDELMDGIELTLRNRGGAQLQISDDLKR